VETLPAEFKIQQQQQQQNLPFFLRHLSNKLPIILTTTPEKPFHVIS